jgi:hypothetical protein
MMSMRRFALALLPFALVACGGGDARRPDAEFARRTVVWLEGSRLDVDTAERLARVGVDEVVLPRGSVRYAGATPVLRLAGAPEVAGSLPVGLALTVEELAESMDATLARTTWQALSVDARGLLVTELILDLPRVQPGLDRFVVELAKVAGVPVVPLLSPAQLRNADALAVAAAAGQCIVAVSGAEGGLLRGVDELASSSLAERLGPLAASGIAVRVAIALMPRTEPSLPGWGDSLDALCEADLTSISTSSKLDRTFVFNRAASWSGRDWAAGEAVAVRWVDAARLDSYLRDAERLVLPHLAGWDLVPAAAPPAALGLGVDGIAEYFSGRGPAPEVQVQVRRLGGDIEVLMINQSPFESAVSAFANWLEVIAENGTVIAQDRGGFERLVLGSRRGGEWQPIAANVVDGVRFQETLLGAYEVVRTGIIRLPSRGSGVTVRWQVTLTTGQEVSGVQRLN